MGVWGVVLVVCVCVSVSEVLFSGGLCVRDLLIFTQHGTRERNLHGLFSAFSIVVLAAADPTGLLSMALELPLIAGVFALSVVLPLSRQAETEADLLGLCLVARACFSPGEDEHALVCLSNN